MIVVVKKTFLEILLLVANKYKQVLVLIHPSVAVVKYYLVRSNILALTANASTNVLILNVVLNQFVKMELVFAHQDT